MPFLASPHSWPASVVRSNQPFEPLKLTTRGTRRGFYGNPRLFVRLHVYFEKERAADSATKLMTSDRARRIAANIAKLPDSSRLRPVKT